LTSSTPFYDRLVPKGVQENAEWRRMLLRLAKRSKQARNLIWVMCKRDPLFFVNSFVWLYEPRLDTGDGLPEMRPFNTYSHQDDAIRQSLPVLGRRDIGVEKSREQGASWMYMALTLWRWAFYPFGDYMLVSRNALMVDNLEDRGSLFVKMHWMIKLLPQFIRPTYTRSEMRIVNKDLGGTIVGAATTESVGVGGRVTWAIFDEFGRFSNAFGTEVLAVTQHTTNCRIVISTPYGDTGPFFDMMNRRDQSTFLRIRLHWRDHPVQNQGLYEMKNGKLTVFPDARWPDGYPFPKNYKFVEHPKFKIRSPYFDKHLAQSPSDQYVARELEIDYGGSVSRVFDNEVLDRLIVKHTREPDEIMTLRDFLGFRDVTISDKHEVMVAFWSKAADAEMRIWCRRDQNGNFPKDRVYAMGADVSAGTGASNSTLVAYDATDKCKVLEMIHNRIGATEWGEIAVAIARWLNKAWLIWESQGPGVTFGQRVRALGYTNVYTQRNEESYSAKQTDTPGWTPTDRNKLREIEHYKDGLYKELVINRSAGALEECRQFIYDAGNRIKHKRDVDADDPSGKNKFHGDLVIADALAWHMLDKYMPTRSVETDRETIKLGSRQWRDNEAKKRLEAHARQKLSQIRVRSA